MNRQKLIESDGGIVFSRFMKDKVGGGTLVYHGAESYIPTSVSKTQARSMLSLPNEGRIALAIGFSTSTKGWDIFHKMRIPEGWTIVINSPRNHYNKEILKPRFELPKIINLGNDFLSDTQLSTLFHASDVLLLPYKVSSGSGVMFDGLAHGLPFIASDLDFFREFSSLGLGLTVKRTAKAFEKALSDLDDKYSVYSKAVESFKSKLAWSRVAYQHSELYEKILANYLMRTLQSAPSKSQLHSRQS